MQLRNIQVFIALVFIIITINTNAQTPEAALEKIRKVYPNEKIFIHFDKENYIAGETIWFKAYVTAAYIPTLYSTSLSVDVVNDSGFIVAKKILPLLNGMAAGSIDLDTSLANANYTVRAYTQLIMAAGEDKCYRHNLTIFNTNKKKNVTAKAKPHIYFLPEGGNLVAGLINTVAFKATDQWGYPVNVGVKVTSFKNDEPIYELSVHDGMGQLVFIPEAGIQYKAICMYESYPTDSVNLPMAQLNGIVLSVKNHPSGKVFSITKTDSLPAYMQPAYVLGVIENSVVFKVQLKQSKDEWQNVIPVDSLPSGIMQITVFTSDDKPLAERLTFINNKEYKLNTTFSTDVTSTLPHAKNEYSFELSDTLEGGFSVAVTNMDKEININGTDDIVSRLLLTDEIKGYVHKPAYYFTDSADNLVKRNLELVLMTNGWRRYSWNDIIKNNIPAFSNKDDYFISINGIAKKENSNKPFENDEIIGFITTKDSAKQFITIPLDKDGKFKIDGLIFNDTATLLLQNSAKRYRDQALKFNITNTSLFNKMILPYTAGYKLQPIGNLQDTKIMALQNAVIKNYKSDRGQLLPDVIVKGKLKSPTQQLEDKYIKGMFGGMASRTLDFINDPMYNTNNGMFILDYLRGRIPGVDVSKNDDGEYVLNYRNSNGSMSIFLDEMQSDANTLASIPANQIALIKIYSNFVGAVGGGGGGTIAIYTKRGNDIDYKNEFSPIRKLKIAGYSPVKQFFSPDYSNGANNKVDNRTTLYWNPYLITDTQNKKISFSFYNSDDAKKFRVIIQGFTLDGRLVNFEKIIE